MIHIATVHWQDDRWVDIQSRYFAAHMGEPYRVYGFLNGIDERFRRRFHFTSVEPVVQHAVKLNILSDVICHFANDEDLLLFIDGDAFPIADVSVFAREKLDEVPLAAVQRVENEGDVQPHPCFCITTVGFWRQIRGDWKRGYEWVGAGGRMVTDVGGNLLRQLKVAQAEWYPMRRSNRINLHPLWFGIYDDVVYHHGAGFRSAISRLDKEIVRSKAPLALKAVGEMRGWLPRRTPIRQAFHRPVDRAIERLYDKRKVENQRLSEGVMDLLKEDERFYRIFVGEAEVPTRLARLAGGYT